MPAKDHDAQWVELYDLLLQDDHNGEEEEWMAVEKSRKGRLHCQTVAGAPTPTSTRSSKSTTPVSPDVQSLENLVTQFIHQIQHPTESWAWPESPDAERKCASSSSSSSRVVASQIVITSSSSSSTRPKTWLQMFTNSPRHRVLTLRAVDTVAFVASVLFILRVLCYVWL